MSRQHLRRQTTMRPPQTQSKHSRTGYAQANAIVAMLIVVACSWVALGYGFPGGSLYRRLTGAEGLTGGLTTAMRKLLRGDISDGIHRHRCALWLSLFLLAQLSWRGFAAFRNIKAGRIWVADLTISLVIFAAVIYLP
jgi:hypothetical protein